MGGMGRFPFMPTIVINWSFNDYLYIFVNKKLMKNNSTSSMNLSHDRTTNTQLITSISERRSDIVYIDYGNESLMVVNNFEK